MSNWADELIANQMGFTYCALFPRAREAIHAWTLITQRPINLLSNICPTAKEWATYFTLHEIDETGMAPGITTQLYGYREVGNRDSELDLDPLGTGFFDRPCATSAIISFGEKKFISFGGAAFVTQDQGLAEEMEKRGYFPPILTDYMKLLLRALPGLRDQRRDRVYLWDRHLGDSLQRIKREQVLPWRVMRLCPMGQRQKIVNDLREEGFDVGTNYPSLPGFGHAGNFFGDRVLNFFLTEDYDEPRIKAACEVIKRVHHTR